MRTLRSLVAPLVTPLAAAVVPAVLVAARPAAAQPAASRAVPGRVEAAPLPVAPRPLATYRFTRGRDASMPTELTLADSAGVLLASFLLPGDRAPRPMAVDFTAFDLVVQGETPAGVLTMRFFRPSEIAETRVVSGRWWRGEEEGTLRGRVPR